MATQAVLAEYVGKRTDLLARAFLTRQPGVEITKLDLDDLDLIAHVLPSGKKSHAVASFGGILWGTTQELPDDETATRFANQKWKTKRAMHDFYMPVLVLFFSMEADKGYYAWANEPSVIGTPRLRKPDKLACKHIGPRTLDGLLAEVEAWHAALGRIVFAKA